MEQIHITDVSLRDGLQNQPIHVDTQVKLELIRRLALAGVRSVEVTSFVSPKAVPQMSDAADLLSRVMEQLPDLRTSALVPNLKGLERACAAGAREIAVVLSATETMNRKNINMGLSQATEVSVLTLQAAKVLGLQTRAYVAVAFDCPFEGPTSLDTVVDLSRRVHAAGADEVVVADTIGSASPGMVKQLLQVLLQAIPADQLAMHFHDTRGMGVANAWAALEAGIRRFDASAGGIGGCPFSPGAAGNLATEDLVLMAERSGFATGIDVHALLDVIGYAETALQHSFGGRSSQWLRKQTEKCGRTTSDS